MPWALPSADINNTLSIALGSSYVNDFIDRGRVKKVYVQGQPGARMSPEDLKKWYVRNSRRHHGSVLGVRQG